LLTVKILGGASSTATTASLSERHDTAELALRKMLVSASDLLFDKFHKDGFVLDR